MGDHDPPPFGYTFNEDFLGHEDSSNFASLGQGQSLLSDHENRSLADFFQNGPFHDMPDSSTFMSADLKDGLFDYNNWGDFIAPAVVHRVETTIPDQAHLQHNFHNDHTFAPTLHTSQFENTQDDLQAASTLFHNSQSSYMGAVTQNYSSIPTTGRNVHATGGVQSAQSTLPMVPTSHGLINEQIAALLPNLSEDGTLDAHMAARLVTSDAQQRHDEEFGYITQKPNFKRSYTFGTDQSFSNSAGYAAPSSQKRDNRNDMYLKLELDGSQSLLRMVTGGEKSMDTPSHTEKLPLAPPVDLSDTEQSDGRNSSEEEDGRPAKKRKKIKQSTSEGSPQKGSRIGKGRKALLVEESARKRRASAASQRLQRENLTEEQKRNNHILSEQKRRNLIKRGFDDLHHLVPEIRNGGLSKSSVLMEAGNFLEKLIQDNNSYSQLIHGIV